VNTISSRKWYLVRARKLSKKERSCFLVNMAFDLLCFPLKHICLFNRIATHINDGCFSYVVLLDYILVFFNSNLLITKSLHKRNRDWQTENYKAKTLYIWTSLSMDLSGLSAMVGCVYWLMSAHQWISHINHVTWENLRESFMREFIPY